MFPETLCSGTPHHEFQKCTPHLFSAFRLLCLLTFSSPEPFALSQMGYCIYNQLPQPNHVHLAPSAMVPEPDLKSFPNPDPSA